MVDSTRTLSLNIKSNYSESYTLNDQNIFYNTRKENIEDRDFKILVNSMKDKSHKNNTESDQKTSLACIKERDCIDDKNDPRTSPADNNNSESDKMPQDSEKVPQEEEKFKGMQKRRKYVCYWVALLLAYIMYGSFPAIQPYSTLPYGHFTYTLAVCLTYVTSPLACFSTFFLRTSSLPVIVALAVVNTCIYAFHVFLASWSPEPLLHGIVAGSVIAVCMALGRFRNRVYVVVKVYSTGFHDSTMLFGDV